ncbi:MAG: pilus assembly protein PilM [Candidatus Marinimicrobia bacterium]|nr:pilus assembly protein PilM [Candidatus Neomarinimicrobiota bacterium]
MFKEAISVGLDIGHNSIKMVGLRKKHNVKIEFLRHYDLFLTDRVRNHKNLDTTVITQVLREMIHDIPFTIRKVHTTLSDIDTEIRSIEIPLVSGDEIKSALRWNLMSTISSEIDKMEYDYQVINRDKVKNSMTVTVGLVSRNTLDNQMDLISRTRLEALSIDIDSLAIYNCFIALNPFKENQTVILLNIGAEKTTIIIVHPDHDPYISSRPIGGNYITRQIESTLRTSFREAEEQKILFNSQNISDLELNNKISFSDTEWQNILNSFSDSLSNLISSANIHYQVLYGKESAAKIFLTGGSAFLHRLDLLIAQQTKIPVFRWNPLESNQFIFDSSDHATLLSGPLFTTAIGLALRD